MRSKPVFSLVIPAYNAEHTLPDAIESLQSQTVEDWEALVIDDGSTDAGADLVRQHSSTDARIHLYRQANQGPSVARNRGLEQARGEYIQFLDADDWLDPNSLERCLRRFAAHPLEDAVHCGQAFARSPNCVIRRREVTGREGKLFPDLCLGNPFPPGSLAFRRTALDEVGQFDPEVPGCEDWDMWLRVARRGARFGYIPDICFYYRFQQGSFGTRAKMMWTSGVRVIERAFDRDPRVSSCDPEFERGGSPDRKPLVRLRHALACCSLAIASRNVPFAVELFDQECADREELASPQFLADSLRHCLWDATATERGDWPRLWAIAETSVFAFLCHVEARITQPGYAGQCLNFLTEVSTAERILRSRSYRWMRAIASLKFW